jgi:TPR repeat protein
LEQLAEIYDQGGRSDAAQAVLREAAVSGDASSMRAFGKYLLRFGDLATRESGLRWLRRAAEAGHLWAMSDLAEALRTDGSLEEADEWLARAAWFGDPNAIEELSSSQPPAEAAEWLKERAREGDVFATSKLAEVLDGPQAESWLRAAAAEGNAAAIETLIWTLKSAGRLSEAEQWLRRATVMGMTSRVSDLAQLLEQESRDEEARQLRRYGVEPDGRTAQPWPWP